MKMVWKGIVVVLLVGMTSAYAATDDVATLKAQITELQARVTQLEAKVDQRIPAPPQQARVADPFEELQAMQQRMNAMMGAHSGSAYGPGSAIAPLMMTQRGILAPDYDMKETDRAYVVALDLPGMDKSKINVEIKEGALLISGERSSEAKDVKGNQFYRQERSFGYFSRVIPLPKDVKSETVQAKYENGVLTVTVDKKEMAKPKAPEGKKIEVK